MTSRLVRPFLHPALEVAVVSGSWAIRTMAMRHRALLAWRSPPSCRRRCPAFFPESAGTGDTPHRWAQAASEWSRSGLSPAATRSEAAVSGPTPKTGQQVGSRGQQQ